MQLQIECNQVETKRQNHCYVCKQEFEMQQARIIVCNDQAIQSGDLCPNCLHKGFQWIKEHFDQLKLAE